MSQEQLATQLYDEWKQAKPNLGYGSNVKALVDGEWRDAIAINRVPLTWTKNQAYPSWYIRLTDTYQIRQVPEPHIKESKDGVQG